MPLRFTVLASGSSGNACLIDAGGQAVLIDAGLGPRLLAARLAEVGASWQRIRAVLLTHTHGDHWKPRTLDHMLRRQVPLCCHPQHADALAGCPSFDALHGAGLVVRYEEDQPLRLPGGLTCRAVRLRHDSAGTFGFRIDGPRDIFGESSTLAYAADLGSWSPELPSAFADADVLALEFNHDEELQRRSGRPWRLIARVLSELGHLSNHQAARLLREVLQLSTPGRLRHLVLLHLSRDCNRPRLAHDVARTALDLADHAHVAVHATTHDRPGPRLAVGHLERTGAPHYVRTRSVRRRLVCQPMFPGW